MLAAMFRFALRRSYFAIVGLLLLTLPLFAAIRIPVHDENICDVSLTIFCGRDPPMLLDRNGPLYAIWQTGMPPDDWWPVAVALLVMEGATTLVLSRRQARAS